MSKSVVAIFYLFRIYSIQSVNIIKGLIFALASILSIFNICNKIMVREQVCSSYFLSAGYPY